MAKRLTTKAAFVLANEVSPMGRRLFQLSRIKSNQRSYQLADELFSLIGIGRATVDGELLARGLVREKRHRDRTRSYVLTDKGRLAANHIEQHINR